MEPCVIDFHVHPLDIMSKKKLAVEELAAKMVEEMDRAGVCKALLYSLEVNIDVFIKKVKANTIIKAVEDAIGSGIFSLPADILRAIEEPEEVLKEHVEMLKTANDPSERILEVSRLSGGRVLAVASPDPHQPRDVLVERVEKLIDSGAVAVKLLPTVQLVDSKTLKKLESVADILESKNAILIIHTGCDPGLWELPLMCEPARPSRFEPIARKYRDLPIVLAHMGAYSLLKPGIFLHEAVDLMRRYPNVYGDTAALDPDIVEYAVRKVGADKILFGSDYPVVVGASWKTLVDVVKGLRLPRDQLEKILWRNAAELLGLKHV